MYVFLRRVPLFSDLTDEDLAQLCEMITEVHLSPGEELFAEGAIGDAAYVIKEGQVEIIKVSGGREVLLNVRHSGEVIGEISLIEEAPRMASVRAREKSLLLGISKDQFEKLLETSSSAVRAVLFTVVARWRSTEAKLRQSEKMAQLGTLTAGLAHELNNPAAAVQRGAAQLLDADAQIRSAQLALTQQGFSPVQIEALTDLSEEVRERSRQPVMLDSLARADAEEVLEDWMDTQGLEDAWTYASTLVDLDYRPEDLERLKQVFPGERLAAVLSWLVGAYLQSTLLDEVREGAARMSSIVKALKSYAYLDQAPVQEVDLHEGLDNTLILLRGQLKEGVEVVRDYDPDLPNIQGYGSELNQVWTNLIDNAIDAMDGKGELVLRTRSKGDWVVIEIQDSGPGIPDENLGRIFDPFFTTKPVGEGTGLGLDISYNIVVEKHRGDISVTSQPGKTTFRVKLPLHLDQEGEAQAVVEGLRVLSDEQLSQILTEVQTIGVVGISRKPHLPSYSVPAYLQAQGYRIIPVNPDLESILGETAYPDLLAIPEPVDEVLIFRRPEDVPDIVDQAIQIGVKVVWMQEGIVHKQAASKAMEAGLEVVMDTCMRTSHRRLIGSR
jgi:signal transduction histidine kinase/predicted CoA-binding protein